MVSLEQKKIDLETLKGLQNKVHFTFEDQKNIIALYPRYVDKEQICKTCGDAIKWA